MYFLVYSDKGPIRGFLCHWGSQNNKPCSIKIQAQAKLSHIMPLASVQSFDNLDKCVRHDFQVIGIATNMYYSYIILYVPVFSIH